MALKQLSALCLAVSLLGGSTLSAAVASTSTATDRQTPASTAPFTAKSYTHLNKMEGLPPELITMHLTLYEGYVKNANLIQAALKELVQQGKDRTPEYAGYKRMYGWEYDGMRLHEAYFDNLGGDGKWDYKSPLVQALIAQYGSYEAWKKDFIATGMIRGIGWVALTYDPQTKRFTNIWVNEHDTGHLVGNQIIVLMDVFEHAYMPKYGLDRAAYIDAFFRNLAWPTANERYDRMTGTSN